MAILKHTFKKLKYSSEKRKITTLEGKADGLEMGHSTIFIAQGNRQTEQGNCGRRFSILCTTEGSQIVFLNEECTKSVSNHFFPLIETQLEITIYCQINIDNG